MTERELAEDPRFLAAAGAISGGTPVNWSELGQPADAEETAVMDELRVLEGLSRWSDPTPATWGPFTIISEIGRGSFGTVYRAEDPNLQLEVALKVIRPPLPGAHVDGSRALNEARLLAQVSHPNVVRVYRAERIGHEVGLSMELIKGQALDELVRLQGAYSAGEATLIGLDLCHALAAIHGAKLLHGDIKANNVMRAEGGRTVLMDFGAGRDLKNEPRLPGDGLAGTPIYLAPEVLAGGDRSEASDIYSLGVLLYYLATGSYPVEGRTRTQIQIQHNRHASRKPLRDVRPDLPDEFIRVVDRALSEKPRDRYQSAGEFESALNQVLLSVRDTNPAPLRWKRLLIAAAVVLALGFGATIAYRILNSTQAGRPDRVGTLPAAQTARDVSAQPPASAAANDTYRIDAALYREQDGAEVRLQPGARVAPGDRLSLEVRASVPTYVYVVNEDDRGESYLLFPLPGHSLTNPLTAEQRHRLPGVQDGEQTHWQVTSPGGREHFLIFASPDPPSPAFERMFASLPRPTAGKPVLAHRLSSEAVGVLRGVGGLSSTPAPKDQPSRLTAMFATPLAATEEAVRGVWVRQITLENPAK